MLAELNALKSRLESLPELADFSHTFEYKNASNALRMPILTYEVMAVNSNATNERTAIGISIQIKNLDKSAGIIEIMGIAEAIKNNLFLNKSLLHRTNNQGAIILDTDKPISINIDINSPHPFFECGVLVNLITYMNYLSKG
jgi:hypothetical protein